MKTFKILLSIVGIALTSITFGQLLSKSDGNILFYTLAFNPANNRLENLLTEFPDKRAHGDYFEVPLASRTYFEPMETDMELESWMTVPFETNFYESELLLESWMTVPFETNFYEAEPLLESWMTVPFETNYYEVEPFIESWMTVPFILEEELEVEDWMRTSWM
jgi:hypothetical protein